jgi:hypothetical protein
MAVRGIKLCTGYVMQQAPAMSMEFYIEDNGAEEIR